MKYSEEFENVDLKKVVVGDEAQKYRHMLEVKYPVSEGRILYWSGDYSIHHIWDYAFNEKLEIGEQDRSDHNILLTEAPNNPKSNKMRMLEAMLETYGWAGATCAMQAILVLYAQGLVTGVVLDAGDGVSHCIPVWEGVMLADQIKRLNVAGRSVTERLVKLLQARGFNFHRSADMDTVRQIKEKFCYVGYDLKVENKLAVDTTCLTKKYRLPDGRVITLGAERFQAPEVLFQPHLGDEKYAEQKGIHEMVYDMIMGCQIDLRKDFFKRIVLSGGSTMYPGLPTRLEKEISDLVLKRNFKGSKDALKKFKLKVEDPPRRKYMVFLGGAVLANLMKDTKEFWISQQEWNEKGGQRVVAERWKV
uniref:Actin-related protein 2 n=1 Tax=Lotharella globosa TaxID=91324 RepID=A0A7S3ZCA8_9EUKA